MVLLRNITEEDLANYIKLIKYFTISGTRNEKIFNLLSEKICDELTTGSISFSPKYYQTFLELFLSFDMNLKNKHSFDRVSDYVNILLDKLTDEEIF